MITINELLNRGFCFCFLISCLMHLSSCNKNDCDCKPIINPAEARFPVYYRFVNDLNSEMKALNLEATTVFPIEYKTNFSMKTFEKIGANKMVEVIVDNDGIAGQKGYIGCATQMELTTHYMINDTVEYVATWRTRTDTIRSLADSLSYFYWPKDTLYCEKTFGHYYDRSK